tara:strand:+ start:2530 stop:3105 length:576 start_codon:yes stop_codon:yes gene_type:complete
VAFDNFRPFTIKIAGITIDPSRLNKFPTNFFKNLGDKVAVLIRNHIRIGGNDVFNKKFPKYTPEYAKRKAAGTVHTNNRGAQHYTSTKPNLSLTGTLLNGLQVTKDGNNEVELEFTVDPHLVQANANQNRKNPRVITLPSHPLPLSIHKYVWDTINNEIAKNLAEAIRSGSRTRGSVAKHGKLDVQLTPAK